VTIPFSREAGQAVQVTERLRLQAMQTVRAGSMKERFARRQSEAIAAQHKRKSSTIQAWRAAETDAARATKQGAALKQGSSASAETATIALDNGADARRSAAKRAAPRRAIERAFRDELRRQSEAEAEGHRADSGAKH
jgi:hypothetical protein